MHRTKQGAVAVLTSLFLAASALAAPPAPVVTITSPADNVCTNQASLNVVVSFQANPGNVKDIDLLVNGQVVETFTNPPNIQNGVHTFALALGGYPEGTLQIQAQGFQGNRNAGLKGTSNTVQVTIDRTAPTISNLSPADASLTNDPTPAISASFLDAGCGVDVPSAHITLDGQDVTAQAQVTAQGFTFTPPAALQDGDHVLAVSVADKAGNGASAQATWTLDATPPQVADLVPADGATVEEARPVMSGTFSDNLSGVDPASVRIRLDDVDITSQAQVTAQGFTFTPTQDLAQGPHSILVEIADLAGNPASASSAFTVSLTPDVLLVDDDGFDNLESFFVQALNARDIRFQSHDVRTSGVPGIVLLQQFKQVIWTTGESFFPALDTVEVDVLRQYLEGGGKPAPR